MQADVSWTQDHLPSTECLYLLMRSCDTTQGTMAQLDICAGRTGKPLFEVLELEGWQAFADLPGFETNAEVLVEGAR